MDACFKGAFEQATPAILSSVIGIMRAEFSFSTPIGYKPPPKEDMIEKHATKENTETYNSSKMNEAAPSSLKKERKNNGIAVCSNEKAKRVPKNQRDLREMQRESGVRGNMQRIPIVNKLVLVEWGIE